MTLDTLFAQAIAIDSAEQRAAFLADSCKSDPALRREVEGLVRDHFRAGEFLERPAACIAVAADEPVCERPGTVIGPYKLMEQIGQGGFGLVFVAEQQRPVHRRVALKVIKPGMDSRQVVARFEAERQALALMDHANIARVLDGGTTTSGRPYFVMELVKGVPITTFCDTHRLTTRDRLRLFVSVCSAVQHAHQKGVIHRDLKPSNVLVNCDDSTPAVKVIDFGVAKAIGQPLTEKTVYTQFTQMVGTPLYMSPEQAGQSGLDVDTRTDIYALGVLLYELLTGTTPFDEERLLAVGFDEMRRIIRDEEPARPSTRISTLGPAAVTVSVNRRTDPKRLSRLCRGELDWIVMKALEKDRNRRYETANDLAMDVQRYLAEEPVLACPPSAVYRLQKLVRRNRGTVLAASLVFLALVAGVIGTTWGLIRAERARGDAELAWSAETERAEEAQKRLAQVEKGTEILASVFREVDPKAEATEGVTLRVLLGRRLSEAAHQLEGEAVGDPLVVARLQHLLGISLRELGHQGQAEAVLVKAGQTRERVLGADHLDTASTKHNLAGVYRDQAKYALAEQLYKEVIEVRTAQLGLDHTDLLSSKNNLALVYMTKRQLELAEPLLNEILAIRTAKLGPDDLKTLQSKHNLAGLYGEQKRWELVEPLLQEVLERRIIKIGPRHLDTLQTKNNLALVHQNRRNYPEAEALFKEALEASSAELGHRHSLTLSIKNNLAALYIDQGRCASAETLSKEVLEVASTMMPADHPFVLRVKRNLGILSCYMKKFDRGIPLLEETLRLQRAKLPPDHQNLLEAQATLGRAYRDAGRTAEAIPLLEEVRQQGPKAPDLAWVGNTLLAAYAEAGKKTEAAALATAQVQAARKTFPDNGPQLATALSDVGKAFLDARAYADAEPLLRESLALGEQKAPDAWNTHNARSILGGVLLGEQKYADAERHLVDGYHGMKRFETDPAHKSRGRSEMQQLAEALERLVQLYDAWGKREEAAKWRQELEARNPPGATSRNPNDK